jgi:hypothetical protein
MDTLPWYRQPWPWFLIALPAIAVVGGIVTTVLAVRSDDGLVASDYYKRGLGINAELSRRERAAELGLSAEISANGLRAGDQVRLRIVGQRALPAEATVQLRLLHPGRADGDRLAVLARTQQSDDGLQAQFVGTWRDDGGAADHPYREWVAESSTWRVDGSADWRSNSGVGSFSARASAR